MKFDSSFLKSPIRRYRHRVKKGRTNHARPGNPFHERLEHELRSKLNRARPSGTDGRIRSRYVRRRASAAEWLHRGIVQTESVLTPIRIGEIRMVKNVEELRAELQPHCFSKVKILGYREIEILETGILKHVAPHVPKLSERRWDHHGTAIGIAAEQVQSCRRWSCRSSIHRQRLRCARCVRRAGIEGDANSLARLEVRRLAVKTPTDWTVRWRA